MAKKTTVSAPEVTPPAPPAQEEAKMWVCSKGHSTPTRKGRGQVCATCGEPRKPAATSPSSSSTKTHQQELDFGEAIDRLAKVKKYAADYGSIAKMLEQVESLEEIAMQCGGWEGLKKALLALESL